ncbi:hypothetical protein F2Q69_00050565 [Brassica cretica]|uniref:Exocyst complex component Sec6 n=1 Tax=Brassica cretica TaxID=69181 RepID=A0A8S9PYA4_BRACR|nr:hypothetical protein F2Q69_00050565 [Brassica cretica]
MKRRRWQHRRRQQHRYKQRHVLPSPPRVILCPLRWCFLRCLLHRSPPSPPPLSVLNHCNLRDEIEVDRKLNNDNDSRVVQFDMLKLIGLDLSVRHDSNAFTLVYSNILEHQPDCPAEVVEKLVGLREGIPKKDTKEVVQECKEIYENTLVDGNPPKTGFVFPRVKCLAASKGSLWRKRI